MPSQDVRPSVCLSVLTHTGILSEWLHSRHILKRFSPLDSHAILVFPHQTVWKYSNEDPITGSWNAAGYEKNRDFRPIYRLSRKWSKSHSYYGRWIGNRAKAFEWYQFQWSWMILSDSEIFNESKHVAWSLRDSWASISLPSYKITTAWQPKTIQLHAQQNFYYGCIRALG